MWFAYFFRSQLDLAQILAHLNEVGPWTWHERDNDDWGPYIMATRVSPTAERSNAKILYEHDGYAVNIHYHGRDPRAPTDFESLRKTVLEQILPSLGARDIAETEDYER